MTKITLKMSPNNLKKAENFFLNYDLIVVYGDLQTKYFLGNARNKICRFCNKKEGQVTFNKDAHAIPQFMGNQNLLSYFECDECNLLFSKYEDSFARFLGVNRTISQIKGKKNKIPKFKDSHTSLEVKFEDNKLNISSIIGDDVWEINEEGKSFTIKTNKTGYVPIYIPKLLIKLGLSMIPEDELKNFNYTKKFLLENSNNDKFENFNLLRIFGYHIPGPPVFDKPFIQLFKSKKENLPIYQIILYYSNYQFQMAIPFGVNDENLQGKKINLPIAPLLVDSSITDKFGEEKFLNLDLTSNNKKTNEPQNITFSYESFEEIDLTKESE